MNAVEWITHRSASHMAILMCIAILALATSSSSAQQGLSTPQGPGSVFQAPHLPAGFAKTFTSRYVQAGQVRLHAVIGGDGPPLLLVHGWPQTWYQWRLVMPELARNFTVIAVDQRGIGLSEKPTRFLDSAPAVILGAAAVRTLPGHFAAWEQPRLFAEEVRAAFKSLR